VAEATWGFDDVSRDVRKWQTLGVEAALVRVAGYRGFGGGRRCELLALNAAGERSGRLLRGSVDEEVAIAARPVLAAGSGATLVDVRVPGDRAVAAGLSCGGQATLIVASAGDLPDELWPALERRESVALAVHAAEPGRGLLVIRDGPTAGSLGDVALDGQVELLARERLADGVAVAERLEGDVLFQTYHPARRLVVVGQGELADALVQQANLLGWEPDIAGDLAQAAHELERLGPADCVVVLSHSAALDAPVLARALAGAVGYVGALGSRGTQARRAGQLRELGVADTEIASIHGPVGLDIRAASPAETALAICAEILAVAAGRPPISLRDSARPIHAAG
jgi:xanthine dehydrogenase accessory factor